VAVHDWSGRHSWESSWTMRSGLRKTRIGGIGNVLVPRRVERGEDLAVGRTGAIERGMLTTPVDPKRGGGIATFYYRLLKASFRTALASISVGRMVVEEGADRASLSLFLATRSRVTKLLALSAPSGF